MPNIDQIKALLASHAEGDQTQFYSVAMQIAATEARLGRGKIAEELRALIDRAKAKVVDTNVAPIPLARPRGELADLLSVNYPKTKLNDMVLSKTASARLARVIREHKSIRPIRSHGLSPRRKLMLVGKPGTGKTLTASALAGELGVPLFVVHLDGLITKFMGETAAKLRLIFDAIKQTRAVYLFDEFDSIGSERGLGNDVGEIRRVVSSFLQMVEQDQSDSLIIAATAYAVSSAKNKLGSRGKGGAWSELCRYCPRVRRRDQGRGYSRTRCCHSCRHHVGNPRAPGFHKRNSET